MSHYARVARVFHALKTSLEELRSFYEGLSPASDPPVASRYFPSYPDNDKRVEFGYIGYLENGSDCTTLRARTLTNPARDIVVKFVDRYGQGAHELLAESDLAPKLLYHGPCPADQRIFMVIMEYVDGPTIAVAKRDLDEETMEKVRSQVKTAIKLLHDHNFVFGDLRLPNIMDHHEGYESQAN
jgi:serine/threonine protein kinase